MTAVGENAPRPHLGPVVEEVLLRPAVVVARVDVDVVEGGGPRPVFGPSTSAPPPVGVAGVC